MVEPATTGGGVRGARASRRPRGPPAAAAAPTSRRAWTAEELAELKRLSDDMPDDSTSSWAEVAQELGTGRTGKSAMNQATAKGFRTAQLHRVAHNWGKDHKVWGADKNKKRAEKRKADQAAAAVASPAVSPPASSAKRQRPVAGAMAEVVAPAEPLTDTVMRARVMPEHTYRQAIARYFLFTLDRPPEDEWMGKCGTVSYIVAGLNLPKGSRGSVVDVLLDVEWCMENDVEYTGQRKIKARTQAAIALDSKEAKLIADGMEDRLGLRLVCEMVNTSRRLKGLMHLGQTAIYNTYLALKPVTNWIGDAKQGKTDPTAPWSIARLGWVTQLMVRLGQLDRDALALQFGGEDKIPDWADINVIGPLSQTQMVAWDETHKEPVYGGAGHTAKGCRRQVRFWRDADGNPCEADAPGATLRPEKKLLKTKYTEETRLCLGVAIRELADGTTMGTRCELFDYSKCWLTYMTEHRGTEDEGGCGGLRGTVIAAVKGGNGPQHREWKWSRRPEGAVFLMDSVTELTGCAQATQKALSTVGISVVGDLLDLEDHSGMDLEEHELEQHYADCASIGVATLRKLRAQAQTARTGVCPPDVNHLTAPNPYASLYPNTWEKEIDADLRRSGKVCVTELVEHIITESEKVMKDTVHEHDWCFFHDALKQMTDQRCMDWMEEKGYLKRWVLPKAGLNEGSAYYRNRPVGDSPELMPLDCSLNKDVDDAVARMVAITSIYRDKYGDDDLRVFSRATLPAQLSAYKRVWDPSFSQSRTAGAATAVRIEQDFARCFGEHLKKIREAQGCIVPGLGSRNGQRAVAAADQRQENRGGHQVKKGWDGTTRWIHPDAQPAWDERMRAAEEEASSQS